MKTRKAGLTKRQGWEQGEEDEQRDKVRNRGRGTMIYGETERSENKGEKTMELGNRCRNRDKRGNSGLKHLNEEQGEQ